MANEKQTAGIRLSETTRLETFSDGVFAIVITLLVLELIQLLHSSGGEHLALSNLLRWEPYVAFFIGFVTVLICWINHHHVFDHIAKTDSKLMWVNGIVLFFITLTPFPTAILAELIKTDATTAFAIFGANYLMIAIGSYAICAYPYSKGLIEPEDREYFRYVKRTYGYSIIYTMIAFGVCFLSVWAAAVLYAGLFAAFAFPKEFAARLMRRDQTKK